ncbi:hypothetical protein OG705_00315 [Streptomyces sp. NBC_00838]|uniref:hypothetical protein n=1 Tax=Streptomyces sp. NBC_00838 TaxID=2903680 RepID=UPI00386DC8C8|nr:hypothetical protein OG705_00315 [Streptomyces sp. NBC_00838]
MYRYYLCQVLVGDGRSPAPCERVVTLKIEALNALVFALALFLAWAVYRRTDSIESAVVTGAATAACSLVLFSPIETGTKPSETNPQRPRFRCRPPWLAGD